MKPNESRTPDQAQGLLRSLLRMLGTRDRIETAAYVVLSVGVALAGSLAAVLLVPLVQPGRTSPVGGGLLDVHGNIERQAAIFAGSAASYALLRWLTAYLGARLIARYGMNLRRQVHAQLIDAPLAALADSTSAEIANALTYNIEIVVQGFGALQQLLIAGVTTAVSLLFALWLSPQLVLAAPLLLVFGLLASRISSHEQVRVSRQYVADMTSLFWHSEDFPRRLRHVRSFEREDAEKASYGLISDRLGDGYRRQLELVASGRLLLELLAAFGIATIFVLAHRWYRVEQSSLIAVGLLFARLLPYAMSTRQSFQQLRSAAPAYDLWRRYTSLGEARASVVPSHAAVADGTLCIERMRLNPPQPGLVVDGLVLRPGELTLISGDSGIGKSSLVDVLAGMSTPELFAARIGARAIGFDEYAELVRRGAYVGQSVRPWQHSVRECLRWAAHDATDEMLRSALLDVGLDKRLAESGQGLDTALHSATNRFSGGELQRLLLAQVILRQPFLAILDETTSALDAAAEIAVLSALRRRLPHTILIVVSHRAEVATIADQRLVIDGDLVASIVGKASLSSRA